MNIAVIVCANGLGHIKRIVKIINCLYEHSSGLKMTLFCESWQIRLLSNWIDFCHLLKNPEVKTVSVSIPVKWYSDQIHYGDWLCKWSRNISTWKLSSFDYVLSDNLVEPLLYAEQVILSGSFLWHDVLCTIFPNNQIIRQYKEWAEELMFSIQPKMIVNRYFAMPATKHQTNTFMVGLIHFNNATVSERERKIPKRILIALGNSEVAKEQIQQVIKVVPAINKIGVEIFCASECHSTLSRYMSNIKLYDFSCDRLDNVDLTIIRGGLGTISDCIAAKVPMLYVYDPNPEIAFNQECLANLGIGMSLQHALQNTSSPLTNSHLYQTMIERFDHFMLQGEADAANFLLTQWKGRING